VAAPAAGRRVAPQPARLVSGFGLGILNDAADETALSLYFGQHVNHVHFDRLHFDLFAQGQPMMPDLGYPDAMNVYVPGVWTWSVNTISHNTVTVDASTQSGNAPGVVELFVGDDWVRGLEVSARGTYLQCDDYRRGLLLIDAPRGGHYAVDFFNVTGGRQHDYSLHGPPGKAVFADREWTAPAKGTLAGENVQLGELYDAPQIAANCAQAASSTHWPIGRISPDSSAKGINSAGDTTPRRGCCQRTSASTPVTRPPPTTCGW
jgi:hypothetical protein